MATGKYNENKILEGISLIIFVGYKRGETQVCWDMFIEDENDRYSNSNQ